jgi:hypothetical protein
MTQILSLIQELNDKRLCAKKFFIWRKAHVISTTCLKDEENITIQIELYKKLYKDWHHNAGKINGVGYPTPLISIKHSKVHWKQKGTIDFILNSSSVYANH